MHTINNIVYKGIDPREAVPEVSKGKGYISRRKCAYRIVRSSRKGHAMHPYGLFMFTVFLFKKALFLYVHLSKYALIERLYGWQLCQNGTPSNHVSLLRNVKSLDGGRDAARG